MSASSALRFPAEWEPQSAILIAWPHDNTDWAERLESVEETYIALVSAIAGTGQHVMICVADDDIEAYADARLRSNRVAMEHVQFVTVPYNDTWLRDTGPITLKNQSDEFELLDFRFTGWGGKFEASEDDLIVQRLASQNIFENANIVSIDFALEGGAIETDGDNTLLTTWNCLHERHPDKSRQQIESVLASQLHQQRVLWLDHGYLEGDDTDAHIDTLARFAPDNAIVYQSCDDPADSHYADLKAMENELSELNTKDGHSFTLYPLPWPQPVIDNGRRLAASYANFLIINRAVLIPAYGDHNDDAAREVIAKAFPGRDVIQIPCRSLIWQNGSLHCITMQLPKGLVV